MVEILIIDLEISSLDGKMGLLLYDGTVSQSEQVLIHSQGRKALIFGNKYIEIL
jgi:hypothetical protein